MSYSSVVKELEDSINKVSEEGKKRKSTAVITASNYLYAVRYAKETFEAFIEAGDKYENAKKDVRRLRGRLNDAAVLSETTDKDFDMTFAQYVHARERYEDDRAKRRAKKRRVSEQSTSEQSGSEQTTSEQSTSEQSTSEQSTSEQSTSDLESSEQSVNASE